MNKIKIYLIKNKFLKKRFQETLGIVILLCQLHPSADIVADVGAEELLDSVCPSVTSTEVASLAVDGRVSQQELLPSLLSLTKGHFQQDLLGLPGDPL